MPSKPKCIIITGRPGAGKTTLSQRLGELLRLPVIRRDEIKEGYVNTVGGTHDQLPADTNALVSGLFFDLVTHYLTDNISVIIEATFQHKVWETRIATLTEIAEPFLIICSVDGTLASERYQQRGLEDPERVFYHGNLLPGDYVAPTFELPTIYVSTEGEYAPPLDEMVRLIRSSLP